MDDIVGHTSRRLIAQLALQIVIVLAASGTVFAQTYSPAFKAVESQATIAPLGQLVVGNFFGHTSVAAISKSEKAIYFFVPDSMENLILTNVVSLPDTPVAISCGSPVEMEKPDQNPATRIAVLMKPNYACLVHFSKDGEPIVSQEIKIDSLCTGIRTVDLEASGKLDIVTFGRFSLGISVSLNQGGDSFGQAQPVRGSTGAVPFNDIAFADFNGDFVPDMAALDWVNHRLLIFYGRGDGTFAQPVIFNLTGEPSILTVADLSGKGYPDIVVGYTRQNRIDIFSGDGFGRFFLRQTLNTVFPVTSFGMADFSGDGTTDIAAYGGETSEVTVFCYDPVARIFRFAGVAGLGRDYRSMTPIYFPTRFRADIVASSPTQKFLKVLKSAVRFIKSPDILVPVRSGSEFLTVCGTDTSNYLIVTDSTGEVTSRYYSGRGTMDVQSEVDLRTRGKPAAVQLLSSDPVYLLVSYADAGLLNLYEMPGDENDVREITAETQFMPFSAAGKVDARSAVVGAAYVSRQDSAVAVSVFTSTKTKGEFTEKDYTVPGKSKYLTSTLALDPTQTYFGLVEAGQDTLVLTLVNLESNEEMYDTVLASRGYFLETSPGGYPSFAVVKSDTLGVFRIHVGESRTIELHPIINIPFAGGDIESIRIALKESTWFVAYSIPSQNAVFLYVTDGETIRFYKSWHVSDEPADIAISTEQNRIYFLNEMESYVSVHTF